MAEAPSVLGAVPGDQWDARRPIDFVLGAEYSQQPFELVVDPAVSH